MSDFGDIEDADVLDTEPPDPEALVRFFYRKRHELAPHPDRPATYDEDNEEVRALMVFVFFYIINKLDREWQKAPI